MLASAVMTNHIRNHSGEAARRADRVAGASAVLTAKLFEFTMLGSSDDPFKHDIMAEWAADVASAAITQLANHGVFDEHH